MDNRFASLCSDASKFGELNDCAVKAVAVVTGKPYKKVLIAMGNFGRRRHTGTSIYTTNATVRHFGYYLEPLVGHKMNKAKTIVSLKKVIPSRGNFLVRVQGHILAVRGGEIHDWSEGRRHRIKEIYRVKKA